jgi:hypothetical protein
MRGRARKVLAVVVALAIGAGGVAVAAPPLLSLVLSVGPITIRIDAVQGPFSSTNSKNGQAVLVAQDLVPGQTRSGEVTVTSVNRAGTYELQASQLVDQPGPLGGVLSSRLQVRISRVSAGGATTQLYSGTLAALKTVALGTLARDTPTTYRVEVTLPAGGRPGSSTTGDNVYQGSRAAVTLTWVGSNSDLV